MRVFTRWDQELTLDESHEVLLNLALWEVVEIEDDGARELLETALLSQDFKTIIDYDVDYARLNCGDCQRIRQVQAFYAKRGDLDLGYDQMAVAKSKFLASERLCAETNDIFRLRATGKVQLLPRVERVLWHASRKIRSILGDVPKLSALRFKFGPGATTQIPKRMASARAKLGQVPACSSELFPAAQRVLLEMPALQDVFLAEGPHLSRAIPVELHTGKIAFVPKSAKEHRTIMVEPSLNTMCQAGIGSFMAARLRRAGVDIRDQTRNQRLARKASVLGLLATVDLSSASDTISTELVYDLLGLDWASFLARFKTGSAELEGVVMKLEKFSSMGNGFTFPLETLIFYALAWGTCVEGGEALDDVSAYGDDIILPSSAYPLLCDVFRACGFVVNQKKSYSSGPFRESCGVDYYQGIDIRPVYLKTGPHVYDLFRVHNFYFRNCDSSACAYLASLFDSSLRLYGPDGYGDGHLLGEWVGIKKKSHLLRGYGGTIFDTFTLKAARSFRASLGDRVLPVYSTYASEGSLSGEPIRGCDAAWDGDSFSVSVPGTSGINRISIYTFKS